MRTLPTLFLPLVFAAILACGSGPPLNPQTSEEDLPSGLEAAQAAEEGMGADYVLYDSSRRAAEVDGDAEEILEIEEIEEIEEIPEADEAEEIDEADETDEVEESDEEEEEEE